MWTILRWVCWLVYLPCSPYGRRKRIAHLMETTGEIREVCAIVVYARDAARAPFTFTDAERVEVERLAQLLESGRVRMPADREQTNPVGGV